MPGTWNAKRTQKHPALTCTVVGMWLLKASGEPRLAKRKTTPQELGWGCIEHTSHSVQSSFCVLICQACPWEKWLFLELDFSHAAWFSH